MNQQNVRVEHTNWTDQVNGSTETGRAKLKVSMELTKWIDQVNVWLYGLTECHN